MEFYGILFAGITAAHRVPGSEPFAENYEHPAVLRETVRPSIRSTSGNLTAWKSADLLRCE